MKRPRQHRNLARTGFSLNRLKTMPALASSTHRRSRFSCFEDAGHHDEVLGLPKHSMGAFHRSNIMSGSLSFNRPHVRCGPLGSSLHHLS